jgi:hypothetical protein
MDLRRYASYAPLVSAVVIAGVLQAVIIARTPTISADGIIFISIARDLPQGAVETFRKHDQHPGYPLLLLAGTRAVQWFGYQAEPEVWMVGSLAIAFVCGLLSVWVVWLFARDLFDARVANIAALIFAVLPVPRGNAADALSDTPHVLAYMLAAWLASTAIVNGSLLRWAGVGVASGLAYWIRPEGLEVFLIALVCLSWRALRGQWSWRRVGLACGTLAAAALTVATPYPILAGKVTSKQLPFAKTDPIPTYIEQLAAAPAPAQTPAAPTAANPPGVNEPVVTQAPPALPPHKRYTPTLVLKLVGSALQAFINSICQGFKFVFIPFYLMGHVELIRRKPDWLQIAMIALLGATHVLILVAVFTLSGYIAHRHVLPLVALAMPFTALGVIYAGDLVARVFKTQRAYPLLATLGLSCVVVLPYTLRVVNREFVPVIEATHWVESRAEPGTGIVCNSPYVEFYGTLPVTCLGPRALTLDDALAQATTDARYDYVVLHVNAHDYRPEWLQQIEPYYRQVRIFPDPHTGGRPKKVLVFQAREGHLSRRARHSHS